MDNYTKGKLTFRGIFDGKAVLDKDGEYFAEICLPMKRDKKNIKVYARWICQCVNNFDQMIVNGQRLAKKLQETREQHNKLLDLLRQIDPLQAKINYAIAEAEKEK